MRTPLLLSFLLSFLCLHVNDNVTPEAAYSRAQRRNSFKANDVMALLEPRTWIDVDNYSLFIARRNGGDLMDLRVNEPLPNGKIREIRAASANVVTNAEGRPFLSMTDVTIDPWREDEPGVSHARTWALPLSALSGKTDAVDASGPKPDPVRRSKDLPTWALVRDVLVSKVHPPVRPADHSRLAEFEAAIKTAQYDVDHPEETYAAEVAAVSASNALIRAEIAARSASDDVPVGTDGEAVPAHFCPPTEIPIPDPDVVAGTARFRLDHAKNRYYRLRTSLAPVLAAEKEMSRAKVEIGIRLTLAFACICFVLVGIPLGIQSHRRESSVGVGLSLAIAGAFYFFCITAESLSKHPEMHAHWLLPIPVLVCLVLGVLLVRRHN